jgi:hypothetical protein
MTTPDKYQAKPRKHEQKEWLYEQYWGELKTMEEMATEAPVERKEIRLALVEAGIPRRPKGCIIGKTSPFAGFYRDENAPTVTSQTHYDESKRTDSKSNLEKDAERRDTVSLDWHKMQ